MNWNNWSGTVHCQPTEILQPDSEEAVITAVKRAASKGQRIRVVGNGHSFSPIAETNDIMMQLNNLQGIIELDKEHQQVDVWAGTSIKELGEMLFEQGLAQENLGDIDVQSIAGATATGTHGTGTAFGNLSTQIIGITVVTATGELLDCSARQNPNIFKAAQISLGTLGIITRIKLQLVPSYKLEYISSKSTVEACLTNLDEYNNKNRNFEYYWFPFTETVQLKISNITDKPVANSSIMSYLNDVVIENGAFWVLSELNRFFPSLSRTVSKISAAAVPTGSEVNYSHQVYATVRMVKFYEMEYNIPQEHFAAVMREMKECIDKEDHKVHFPVECRFVKGDDIWLSPAYKRDSAYIAVHMYKGMPYEKYFNDLEAIFKKYEGRPHWGKMHNRTGDELAKIYPRWTDFQEIRKRLDPKGMFLNDYMTKLFK